MDDYAPQPGGAPRGRGTSWNPQNRFERIAYVDENPTQLDTVPTLYLRDPARSIISYNDSPDVFFDASFNPYRGCEHGCIYCFARPTHEYLGFSAGLDFETRILVKEDAPELLRKELAAKKWKPQVLGVSGVTDCYQPIERKLEITRRCLEVLVDFRNPCTVVTKSRLVGRDADLLAELARFDASLVAISITTLDDNLARSLEPRAPSPELRLEAIEALTQAGVPVAVLVAPIIPGLNDHEMPKILQAARKAGALSASFTLLRLPWAVAPLFERWLEENAPDRKDKVLNRILELREGKLNDPRFGSRHKGAGVWAAQLRALFDAGCRRAGLSTERKRLSIASFRRPAVRTAQRSLFDGA